MTSLIGEIDRQLHSRLVGRIEKEIVTNLYRFESDIKGNFLSGAQCKRCGSNAKHRLINLELRRWQIVELEHFRYLTV